MVVSTVTVPPPELPSNVAVSADCFGIPPVAAHVPAVPPVAEAHDAVLDVDHVPVPPTQKQVAALAHVASAQKISERRRRFMAITPNSRKRCKERSRQS